MQRQTVIGQFYQADRLVVEGKISVCFAMDTPNLTLNSFVFQQDSHASGEVAKQ